MVYFILNDALLTMQKWSVCCLKVGCMICICQVCELQCSFLQQLCPSHTIGTEPIYYIATDTHCVHLGLHGPAIV